MAEYKAGKLDIKYANPPDQETAGRRVRFLDAIPERRSINRRIEVNLMRRENSNQGIARAEDAGMRAVKLEFESEN